MILISSWSLILSINRGFVKLKLKPGRIPRNVAFSVHLY